jgi:SAM-dependent methyltransferase
MSYQELYQSAPGVTSAYAATRFVPLKARAIVWQEIVRYLQRKFTLGEAVLDAGCGYGDFIRNVSAPRRFALDLDASTGGHLPEGIDFRQGSMSEIEKVFEAASLSSIFSSNVLEHLTREDISAFFAQSRKVLKDKGLLVILMPNYRRAFREYFDDYTHLTPLSDIGIQDWLKAEGFDPIFVHPGFMPFSVRDSRLPVTPWLVRLWLWSPWKPGAKQMLVVARKRT